MSLMQSSVPLCARLGGRRQRGGQLSVGEARGVDRGDTPRSASRPCILAALDGTALRGRPLLDGGAFDWVLRRLKRSRLLLPRPFGRQRRCRLPAPAGAGAGS